MTTKKMAKSVEESTQTAMKQYLEAKKKLEQLQAMYRTEYQREFVNWTDSVARIQGEPVAAGLPSERPDRRLKKPPAPKLNAISTQTQNSEVKKLAAQATSQTENVEHIPKKVSPPKSFVEPLKPVSEPAISPENISPAKTETTIESPGFLDANKVLDLLKDTVDQPVSQVLEKLPPAGISEHDLHTYREKRHFPESNLDQVAKVISQENLFQNEDPDSSRILKYSVEPPTTFKLAQDLLAKAHQRSQKLEISSDVLKVEDI